jgi:hypothetical protein
MLSPLQGILRFSRTLAAIVFFSLPSWAGAGPVTEGDEGRRAFDELGAYYRDGKSKPSFEDAFKDLDAKEPQKLQAAGRYLAALFAQSFADESNYSGNWIATPRRDRRAVNGRGSR